MSARIVFFSEGTKLLFVLQFIAIHPRLIQFIEMVVSTDPQREQVLKLIEEKEKIEKKIADLGLVLKTVSSCLKLYQYLTLI